MKRKSVLRHRSEFLSPIRLIRNKQFSKRDVARIKNNIAFTTSIIRYIVACFLFVFATGMMIMMGFATNWKQVEVYGFGSLIAQIGEMSCCFVTIILLTIAYFTKSTNKVIILNRVAAYFLFIGISLQMLLGIYADAQMGFTTERESLSASIIFLAALLVVQPAYWLDAILLDSAVTLATIFLSIFCRASFGMQAIHYYIVISLAFPLCCYVIDTLLFYAEFQHYKEILDRYSIIIYPRENSPVVKDNLPDNVTLLDLPLYPISSTAIRERLRRNECASEWLPEAVERELQSYLREHPQTWQ